MVLQITDEDWERVDVGEDGPTFRRPEVEQTVNDIMDWVPG